MPRTAASGRADAALRGISWAPRSPHRAVHRRGRPGLSTGEEDAGRRGRGIAHHRGMRTPAPLPPQLALAPFTVREASEAGLTRRRTRARDLSTPFHGVRMAAAAVGLETSDLEALCVAYAARMRPGDAFGHETAARLWGLPLPRPGGVAIHVAAPAPRHQPRGRGVIGHRLGAAIPVAMLRGLPVVAPCDAWCQLGASLPVDALIAAGDRLVGWPRALATLGEVDGAIARHGSRRGAAALRTARRELRPGSASPRETWLRLAIVRAGIRSRSATDRSPSRAGAPAAISSSGGGTWSWSTTATSTATTSASSTGTSAA